MDLQALKLASQFAYAPNAKGYCGLATAQEAFLRCVHHGECNAVMGELSHFIVLYPYLQTIAHALGRDPFDYAVIEAYWFGNALLEQITLAHYQILIDAFEKQGVPSWLIDDMRGNMPKRFIPTHLFQVLHVGVGQASGAVPFDIHSIHACAVRWGIVESASPDGVSLRSVRMVQEHGEYAIQERCRESLGHEQCPFGIPPVGSWVAIHWGCVAKILTNTELANLRRWTMRVLDSVR